MIRIKQKKTTLSLVFAFVAVIAVAFLFSGCSNEEAYRLVKVQSFEGEVSVQREEKLNAFEGLQLITNDTVSVGDKSFLELLADSDKHIAAEENTGFVLHSTGDENSGDITIDLLYGKSLFTIDNKLNESSTFAVNTPNATLSVRGTSFSAAYDEETKTTNVEVYSGTVQLNSGDEELLIEKDGIATIITTDEGVKIITNSTAGNPNAISIPENTEKLFAIAMTYPQKDNYSALNAEYKAKASDYTAKETGISDDGIVFQKFIGLIKNHNEEISKFFEENKDNAVANTNKQADITDWFKEKIAVGDNEFRIDKAIMDISIYGSNIERKYITSDTYKVNTEGVDMYFCANGVEISFYGGFEKSAVVTTATTTTATTTTAPETTVPETTTVETTTTTATTTAATTVPATTKKPTTTKKANSLKKNDRIFLILPVYKDSDWTSFGYYTYNDSGLLKSGHYSVYLDKSYDNDYIDDETINLYVKMTEIIQSHLDELNKKHYNKYLENGFDKLYQPDDMVTISTTFVEDVTDWFSKPIIISNGDKKLKITVTEAIIDDCYAYATPEPAINIKQIVYTHPGYDKPIYISHCSYDVNFDLYVEEIK